MATQQTIEERVARMEGSGYEHLATKSDIAEVKGSAIANAQASTKATVGDWHWRGLHRHFCGYRRRRYGMIVAPLRSHSFPRISEPTAFTFHQ